MMQFGLILNITSESGKNDKDVISEYYKLGDMAEPLGFDSLFVLEHHFSDYVLSPSPLLTLAYFSGRTKKIKLGTAVIVLPWHDPIKIAEQIALLDILSNGRCLFCFGRGASSSEYKGFCIPMTESRMRFLEAFNIITGLLNNESFRFNGVYYNLPEISIRPKPINRPQDYFYGSSGSEESIRLNSNVGLGMLLSTNKDWKNIQTDILQFNELSILSGHSPKPPILVIMVSVHQSRENAFQRAYTYIDKDLKIVDDHYQFSRGHLSKISTYESYVKTENYYKELLDNSTRKKIVSDYINLQIVGTPDDCVQQIRLLHEITGINHIVLEFSYGRMPWNEAASNMKLFARKVMQAFK